MKEKKKGVVMRQEQIAIEKPEQISALFGSFDGNVKILEQELGVTILSRDSGVRISGDDVAVEKALSVVRSLLALSAKGEAITEQNVRYSLSLVQEGDEGKLEALAQSLAGLSYPIPREDKDHDGD